MYAKTKKTRNEARALGMYARTGATLVELLVVMSLIGLLLGMLIPSINRSMAIAKSTVCKSNLREIGHAVMMYQVDYDGSLPTQTQSIEGSLTIKEPTPWFAELFPTYLSDPQILVCPKDPFGYRMQGIGTPMSDPKAADLASYGMSGFVMSASAAGNETAVLRPSRPHNTILIADLGPDVMASGPQLRGTVGPSRNASLMQWDDGFDPFARRQSVTPWVTTRHGRGVNMLTLTGGVQEARTEKVMKSPVRRYYADCASGGCTFCNRLRLPHYSFAKDRLYWWTGSAPTR